MASCNNRTIHTLLCLIPVITDDTHLGQFSRNASATTIQSLLVSSNPFDSGVRHAPELRDRFASVGIAPTSTQAAPLALGRPMLPSLDIGATRVPSSEAELLHVQYLRAQALMRIRHQRQIITNLRTSLLGPSACVNESIALVNHGSLNGNSLSGNSTNGSQERKRSF
jgi:hypothetical protein